MVQSGVHQAFATAGRVKGLEIWRIESFQPVTYPKNSYGKFYSGDSYIVLNTKEDNKGRLSWDVHFWLGAETSRDEAGSAAIFTVQLDDSLGGLPVQHREVENHESQLFLSYFKNGIRYEAGGVSTGFTHVKTNQAADGKRLFQVKGRKNIRVRQVNLSVSAMNRGDCFILDSGNDIYIWVGRFSKRVEKLKAISAANQIKDQDHAGRAQVNIIDQFSNEPDRMKFFEILGDGSPDLIPDESSGGDDLEFEKNEEKTTTLYKVSDAQGQKNLIEKIAERPIRQDMLKSEDCFILDTSSGLYVWVGKKATQNEKTQALSKAQNFMQTKKYPSWTQVQRIVEGAETAPFKQYFTSWRDVKSSHIGVAFDADAEDEVEFDATALHKMKKSGGRALGFMPDNGDGKAEVFVVQNFKLVPVEPKTYGIFFGGDSYVIKYEYNSKLGGHGHLIYYWQGRDSTQDEKAASAMFASKMNREQLKGKAILIRVVQFHAPRHFLKIFKGKLITFVGGHQSGFKNIHDHDTYDKDGTRLFRVRGTSEDDVRADQFPEKVASLASDDVFILETSKNTYIWEGRGGSDIEKQMAANIVKTISPDRQAKVIKEGSEPSDFWTALGGKGKYDTELDPPGSPILEPRLFHCNVQGSKFRVEEVNAFEQDDLEEDDVMVLDGGDEIYIWIGNKSTEEEKEKSIEMAKQYLRTDPTERNEENATIITIQQGNEPRSFKRFFTSWNDKMWEVSNKN